MSASKASAQQHKYRPETRLVQSGILRSQFGETSEALFLTQGYVYDNSAQAEARFKGEDPGYQYSRFANPTVTMFEQRIAEFEGAEAARATATGMAAVTLAMMGQVKAGDHIVASKAIFGSCLYVMEEYLPRYGVTSTIIDGRNLDEWRAAFRPNTKTCFLETPTNPNLEVLDIAGDLQDRACRRRHRGGRQCVLHPALAKPARARRRLRGLFHHQAYRRPGPLPRRRHSRLAEVHQRQHPHLHPADRPLDVAVQCLGDAQGTGNAAGARAPADRHGGRGRDGARRASEGVAADLSGAARPPAGRDRRAADARRLDLGGVRSGRRQERRVRVSGCAASSCASPTIWATPRA